MKSAATEVLRRALPGTVRVATAGILDLSPLIEKEAGQALASYARARLDGYLEAKKSLRAFTEAVTLALIMRTLDPDQYRRFARGELEDREAVQWLFSRRLASIDNIRGRLEAVVIVAAMDVQYPEDHYLRREHSPYLRELDEIAKRASSGDGTESDRRARWVVSLVDSLEAERMNHDRGLGFNEAVRRLDLVSTSLVNDTP